MLDPVRPKSDNIANLYEDISGESYIEMGLPHFMKDFHDSIHASWTTDELYQAIPSNSNRNWVQIIPFGFPSFQIIIGLPEGENKMPDGQGLSSTVIEKLIPKKFKPDWDMLKLSFSLAKKRKSTSPASQNPN